MVARTTVGIVCPAAGELPPQAAEGRADGWIGWLRRLPSTRADDVLSPL
jgi:hypothetical protein